MALYRLALLLVNILSANAPYFTILLCLIFWMILLVRGRVLPLNQLIVSAHINIQSVMEWFKMTFYFSLINLQNRNMMKTTTVLLLSLLKEPLAITPMPCPTRTSVQPLPPAEPHPPAELHTQPPAQAGGQT